MINRATISLSCILILTLFNSCFKKQKRGVNNPELPNYSISGTVYHSVTNEPLSDAKVTIGKNSTVTDSLGNYCISNILGGEIHTLSATKTYFETFQTHFLMSYDDLDSFDIVLGKMLYYMSLYKGPSPTPNGLAWTGDIPWMSAGTRKRIYVLNEAEGLKWVKHFNSPGSNPDKGHYTTPYGLTTTEKDRTQYLWISVSYETSPPKIMKMAVKSDTTLQQEARYDTPEGVVGSGVYAILNDLTYDGRYIWSCSSAENMIFKHNSDMTVMERFEPPVAAPTGIAWDGQRFLLSSVSTDRLFLLNKENLDLIGFYVFSDPPEGGLVYRNGFLWACKHGSQNWPSYFHKYVLE